MKFLRCVCVFSDSETAFRRLENRLLIICFCFVGIDFFRVCLFDLIYPTVCLCSVITRSYLSFFIEQLCNTIICILPRLSLIIRFRMDAIFVGYWFCFPKLIVFTIFVRLSTLAHRLSFLLFNFLVTRF